MLIIKAEDIPKDDKIIPSVWSMRRKRNLVTERITKNKARLSIYKRKQTTGINHWETHSPVVMRFVMRLMIVCAMVLG